MFENLNTGNIITKGNRTLDLQDNSWSFILSARVGVKIINIKKVYIKLYVYIYIYMYVYAYMYS